MCNAYEENRKKCHFAQFNQTRVIREHDQQLLRSEWHLTEA